MKRTALLIPLVLVLAGCAPTAAPAPVASAEPVTLDNCGFDLTVDTAPERVVTIKSTSTELLLALGLGDRIIGTAFQDGPVPDEWAADAADIPVVSEKVPSEEALLELEPDFVFAGWESNLTADGAGDRQELADLGIGSYVAPAACATATDPVDFASIRTAIGQAGQIFGVTGAADALLAEQQEQLDGVVRDDRDLSALWWSSGTDTPYVGGGTGAPEFVLESLGVTNIGSDLDADWSSLNWEAIVAANPDVIVLVDAAWNTAESKKAFLAENPATATLDAVKNERYLVIPFAAGEVGVRTVPAIVDLADQLKNL